jgi:hypothetical protein
MNRATSKSMGSMNNAASNKANDVKSKVSLTQLFLLATLVMAGFAAACGGGNPAPVVPPNGVFSTASLKGTYAFSMSGEDSNGFPIFRIGSFQADGAGNVSAAIEDVNDSGTVQSFEFLPAPASVYTMNTNGKGSITLAHNDPTVSGVVDMFQFTLVLTSASGGLMIETDGSSTMSGKFQLQSITTNFAQSYAFDTSGLDLSLGASESIIGAFTTNGSAISGGTLDDNNDAAPSGPQPISPGTITFDASTGAQFGRGSFQLNTNIGGQLFNLTFEFYVIDGSHLQFVETDGMKATVGSAIAQSSVPTNVSQFPGSFVLSVGGGAFNSGNFGPISRVGRYTADGSGNISGVGLDQNFSGGPSVFPASNSSVSAFTYTIDGSGDGRGTLTLTDKNSGDVFSFVFYLASASQGFIQDESINIVADGSLNAQTTTSLTSSIAGNYAFNWSGTNSNGGGGNEEDFAGVFTIPSGGGALTNGDLDLAELGEGKVDLNVALNGTITINGSGTGGGSTANTLQLVVSSPFSQTINFHVYAISNTNFMIVGTDSGRVVMGPLVLQQ